MRLHYPSPESRAWVTWVLQVLPPTEPGPSLPCEQTPGLSQNLGHDITSDPSPLLHW